jgi:branched-chain amino acid transport system substrate-binding protein
MAVAESGGGAAVRNTWKILAAVFIVLTIVLGGGLAYVATLSRGTTGTVTYPIGIEIAISGTYATDGPLRRDGAFLAVDQMNDQLAAAGSPVRFQRIPEDSGGTPTGATNSFNALLAAGVKVIVGPLSSGEVGAIMPLANANKIVSISPSSTAPRLAAVDYSFRVAPNDAFQAKALCRLFATAGITKLGVIARDDDYGRGIANLTENIFKNAPFNGQVTKVMYDPAASTHTNEVATLSTAINGYGTTAQTAVLIVAFETDGLDILDKARQDPTLSSVRWFGSETLKRTAFLPPTAPTQIGDFLVARNLTGFFASASKNPVVTSFEQNYTAKYGRAPSPYAYYAYDAAWIAMLAVLRAGKYDGEAIRAMIPLVGMQYVGASGHKVFDANGDYAAADYRVWHVTHPGTTYGFTEVGTWFYATDTIRWD